MTSKVAPGINYESPTNPQAIWDAQSFRRKWHKAKVGVGCREAFWGVGWGSTLFRWGWQAPWGPAAGGDRGTGSLGSLSCRAYISIIASWDQPSIIWHQKLRPLVHNDGRH